MKINKQKLDALHAHVKGNGSGEPEVVAKILGCEADDTDIIDAYVAALQERNPELFGGGPVEDEIRQILMKLDNGTLEELDIISEKGNKIYVEQRIPRDKVDLIIAGKEFTVDILELERRNGADTMHGFTVARILNAARVAKG